MSCHTPIFCIGLSVLWLLVTVGCDSSQSRSPQAASENGLAASDAVDTSLPGAREVSPAAAEQRAKQLPATMGDIVKEMRKVATSVPPDGASHSWLPVNQTIGQALIAQAGATLDGNKEKLVELLKSKAPAVGAEAFLRDARGRMDSPDDGAVRIAIAAVWRQRENVLQLPDTYGTAEERLTKATASGALQMVVHREAYNVLNQVIAETSDDLGVPRHNAPQVISPLEALLDDYREATNTPRR